MKSPIDGVPAAARRPHRCPANAAEDCLYRNCLIHMKDIYVFVQQAGSLMPP
jgi:hypothetical protein